MAEIDPHKLLGEALKGWAKGDLPSEPPRRWERFSDVVILPSGAFEQPEWGAEDGLWEVVAEALGAERVARMGEVLLVTPLLCMHSAAVQLASNSSIGLASG